MKLLTHLFAGLVLALLGLAGLRLWTPSSEKKRGEGDPSGTKPGEVDHDRNFFNGSACLLQLPFANRSRSGDDVARRRSKDIVHSLMVYVYQAHSYQLVTATHEYIGLCLGLFPKGVPMASSNGGGGSQPVCVLAATADEGIVPIFWSDFDRNRGVPNFVAYRHLGRRKVVKVKRNWKSLPGLRDTAFRPGFVSASATSHCSMQPDAACGEQVSSRGHLATLAAMSWDFNAASATNTYANAAPSRQPFDGAQWNKREIKIQRYAERHGEVYVVVGTSLESDGTLPEDVEVPSMFWSAVYDPRSSAAVAWACRNGLREKDGGCYCADDLSARELESVVGIRPFPGVDTARMLSDF